MGESGREWKREKSGRERRVGEKRREIIKKKREGERKEREREQQTKKYTHQITQKKNIEFAKIKKNIKNIK